MTTGANIKVAKPVRDAVRERKRPGQSWNGFLIEEFGLEEEVDIYND